MNIFRSRKTAELNAESFQNYRILFDNIADAVIMADQRGVIVDVNQAALSLFGYVKNEFIGRPILTIHPKADRKRLMALFKQHLKAENIKKTELPIITKKGEVKTVELSVTKLNIDGKTYLLGAMRDMTERKCMEKNMGEYISLFSSIAQSIGDALLVVNLKGRVVFYNDNFKRLWQIPDRVIAAKDDKKLLRFVLSQLVNPKEFIAKVNYLYKHPKDKSEDDIFFKDGKIVERVSIPQFNGTEIIGRVWDFRDVTHHRQAEKNLADSEYFFKESQRKAFIGSYKTDFVKGVWESSEVLDQIFGIRGNYKRTIPGWLDIVHPDDRDMMDKYLAYNVIKKRQPFDKIYRIIRQSDGAIRWVHGLGQVDFNRKGQPLTMIGTIQDITDAKLSEEALAKSENKYRRLFEAAKDGILILNAHTGEITEVNPYLMDLLGYSHEQFLHKKLWQIGLFKDIVSSKAAFEELQAKKYIHYEDLPLKTKSGETIEVEFVSNVYGLNGEKVVQCNIRDISARKKIEQLKLRAEAQYREVLERSNDGIVMIQDGLIKYANKAMETMTGYKVDEILGQPMMNFIAPTFKKLVWQKYNERMSGIPSDTRYEFSIVTKDKTIMPVETNSSVINFEGGLADMAIIRDMTRTKEIDRIKSEFIAVASHQLRTPLTGIKWFSQLLLSDKSGDFSETQLDYIKEINASNERMIKLVNDLLDVSHIETGRKFSVVKETSDVIAVIKRVVNDRIVAAKVDSIRIELAKGTPKRLMVPIDEKKIEQVFLNLISNSLKYSGSGKKIIISAKKIGDIASFSVKDFGLGIPKHQQRRIFEKFFRADNIASISQEGTGLGLYIAKSIIEGHGGKISFESRENKGTTFYFTLPLK